MGDWKAEGFGPYPTNSAAAAGPHARLGRPQGAPCFGPSVCSLLLPGSASAPGKWGTRKLLCISEDLPPLCTILSLPSATNERASERRTNERIPNEPPVRSFVGSAKTPRQCRGGGHTMWWLGKLKTENFLAGPSRSVSLSGCLVFPELPNRSWPYFCRFRLKDYCCCY